VKKSTKIVLATLLGLPFVIAAVAVAVFVTRILWFVAFDIGRQHRTDLSEWKVVDLYDGAIQLEMPEGEVNFRLHELPHGLFTDSSWDVEVSFCILTDEGYHCNCILPKNLILELSKDKQRAWLSWMRTPHETITEFAVKPGVTDYKRDLPIPYYKIGLPISQVWQQSVHIRYFSSDYEAEEISTDQEAIQRILRSVRISGDFSDSVLEDCKDRPQREEQWEEFLAEKEASPSP